MKKVWSIEHNDWVFLDDDMENIIFYEGHTCAIEKVLPKRLLNPNGKDLSQDIIGKLTKIAYN